MRILIQLAGVVTLARILTPFDFGLIAMVVAFVGIGELLRDFGLSSATLQARELTLQQRTNLFWTNALLGAAVALLAAASAPLLAALYREPRLVGVTLVMSMAFLVNGMTVQYRANLARDLRFMSLQLTDLVPAALGLATALVLGLQGFGYWALVGQQIAQAVFGLALAAAFGRWLPGLPRPTTGMRALYAYGMHLFGSQVLSYATKNADSVIIGIRFGATPLGLYNRAYELVVHPTNQIIMPTTNVAVSVLARLQDEPERFRRFLLTGQRALLYLVLPLMGLGGVLASPLVAVVLGEGWLASAQYMQVLVVASAINACCYPLTWYALSTGSTRVVFRISLLTSPLWVAAVVIGSFGGVLGVAVGFAAGQLIHWLISLLWFGRVTDAPSWALFRGAMRAVASNLPPVFALAVLNVFVVFPNSWIQIAVGIGIYLVLWVGTLGLVPAFRRDAADAIGVVKLLRK